MLHLIPWHITLRATTLLSFATHGFSSSLKISDFFCNEFPLVCVFSGEILVKLKPEFRIELDKF
jgi:hypothetical protein